MYWVFLVCAIIGGTVLFCQLAMTLLGLGGDALAHDLSLDTGHGFDGHAGSTDHDVSASHSIANWLFGVISFRTLTAACTFFGLIGLATEGADWPLPSQLGCAVTAGLAAMYGVHWIVRGMGRLSEDGTLRIDKAIGAEAEVYLPIAAAGGPTGKVQIKLQGRLMEFEALTRGPERLPTGTRVRVIGVAGNCLEVLALSAVEAPIATQPPAKV